MMASIQKLTRKSGTVYRVFIRNKGSRTISKVFKSKSLAKEYAKRIQNDVELKLAFGNLQINTMTLSNLIDEYMTRYEGVYPKTRRSQLSKWLSILGNQYVIDITKNDIRHGINQIASMPVMRGNGRNKSISVPKKRTNSTLNRYKATISAVLQFACEEYDLPINPARLVRARRESDGRVRFLSDQERGSLLTVCKKSSWDKLYLIVLMAITTGARRSELLNLTWSDICFDHCLAYIRKTKNGEPRVLPLTDDVIYELRKHRKDAMPQLIFYSQNRTEQPFEFRKVWIQAVELAQLKDFKFHDLRHTCASYLAQNGATLLEIADVLGHKQVEMTKRYSHLCVTHKRKLINYVMSEIT